MKIDCPLEVGCSSPPASVLMLLNAPLLLLPVLVLVQSLLTIVKVLKEKTAFVVTTVTVTSLGGGGTIVRGTADVTGLNCSCAPPYSAL